MGLAAKLFAFAFLLSPLSQAAYFTADFVTAGEDATRGTHVIISGNGMEVGRTWLEIARTQALVYGDKSRHGKIHIISAYAKEADLNLPKSWGYTHIQASPRDFNDTRLLEALAQVPEIASIDFIGHNGAILGFALEDYNHRFFLSAVRAFAKYKGRFMKNSYVRLFGCNTGWNLAPVMAQQWGVPTAGSVTSEGIQFLHSNNTWYFQIPGFYPPGGSAVENSVSFGKTEPCRNGGCTRLKTANEAYDGKHGKYQGTLPFIKFFCGPVPEADCFRRMALSTQSQISVVHYDGKPTLSVFARGLADQFCNASAGAAAYNSCLQKITSHIMTDQGTLAPTFSTIKSPLLACTFDKCAFKTQCKKDCDLIGDFSKPATTLVDELNAYKRGFESW